MPKRNPLPVSSFGPEILAALIKGTQEVVKVEFKNAKIARRFQLRLQQLRGAMKREEHPLADLSQRATTSLLWGERAGVEYKSDTKGSSYACVIIRPRDTEFVSAINKAGVRVTDEADILGNPKLEGPVPGTEEEPTVLDVPEVSADPISKYKLDDLA